MLAAKTALAARVDALGEDSGTAMGIENRAKLEMRLKSLEENQVCTVRNIIAINFLPINTAWQIGLHEPKPLVGLSSSYNTYTALKSVK